MTHTATTQFTYCFLPLITSFTFANGFVNTTDMLLANLWQLAYHYRTTNVSIRLKSVMSSKSVIGETVIVTGLPRCDRVRTRFWFSKYRPARRRIVVSSSATSSSRSRLLGLLKFQKYRCKNHKSRILLYVTCFVNWAACFGMFGSTDKLRTPSYQIYRNKIS